VVRLDGTRRTDDYAKSLEQRQAVLEQWLRALRAA